MTGYQKLKKENEKLKHYLWCEICSRIEREQNPENDEKGFDMARKEYLLILDKIKNETK